MWIYNSDYNWQKYPVLRFDFSVMRSEDMEMLQERIITVLQRYGEKYNISLKEKYYDSLFEELLTKLLQKTETHNIVILVDEYDAPIIHHITDIEKAKEMREVLKGFYTIIKSMDEAIRFVLLTG